MKKNKNKKLLTEFSKYCAKHPELRFWQALKNWSGADFIQYTKNNLNVDTYEWTKKDEFGKAFIDYYLETHRDFVLKGKKLLKTIGQ